MKKSSAYHKIDLETLPWCLNSSPQNSEGKCHAQSFNHRHKKEK